MEDAVVNLSVQQLYSVVDSPYHLVPSVSHLNVHCYCMKHVCLIPN